jgi:hypothetical protein
MYEVFVRAPGKIMKMHLDEFEYLSYFWRKTKTHDN